MVQQQNNNQTIALKKLFMYKNEFTREREMVTVC